MSLINIYEKKFDIDDIYNSTVVGNILYILYFDSAEHSKTLRMLKFSMIHKCIVADDYITSSVSYLAFTYIDNNKLYMFTDNSIHNYSTIVYDLNTLRICGDSEVEETISRCNVQIIINVVINNDFYFVSNKIDKKDYFDIINKKGEILISVNYSNTDNIDAHINKNVIYLPKSYSYIIRYHDGFLIIYYPDVVGLSDNCTCVSYNLSKKTLTSHVYNVTFFTSSHCFVNFENELDKVIMCVHDPVRNDKILLPNYPSESDHDIFQYNNVSYSIHVKDKCLKICMIHNPQLHISNKEGMDSKHIKIGTENENVMLPLELLLRRSALIKGLFSDFSDVPDVLIYNSYVNMDIYKEFITDGKVKNENLHKLYHICDYLNDVETDYVSEVIIAYVRENDVSIGESFKFLELFSVSSCDDKLNSLLYIIMLKYDNVDVYNNILEYKGTKLYDFVSKQLFLTACNSISKYN